MPAQPSSPSPRRGPLPFTKLSLEALMVAARCDTAGELARMLGLTNSNVRALRSRGVPIHRADEFACKIGLHPTQVWGEEFYQALQQAS